MSTTIQIKRSSTASAIPVTGDIAVGELAVNLVDKRLFTKKADGTIIELSTSPTDLDAATLRIDGVEITASATELNKLDGFTGSTTELNLLDGLTASTAELNKLDGYTGSTAELNILDGVTATTAELNVLDGITATTAELNYTDGVTSNIQTQLSNKQPLDAQLTDISILIPTDGSFIVADGTNFVTESGDTAISSLGVTATAAELNTLDGITATTAELNITDGLTATTTELNTLDGITASTTELNYTDGVTSNIQTQLNGKATTAQGALADSAVQPNDNVSFGTGSFSGAVDVIGTVTADGLVVDGSTTLDSGSATPLVITRSGGTSGNVGLKFDAPTSDFYAGVASTSEDFVIGWNANLNTRNGIRVTDGGDVSFYEDTGTTAKMVWDASAESLEIGTSSGMTPTASLAINENVGGTPAIEIIPNSDDSNNETATIRLWGTKFGTANRHSEIKNITDGSTASNELAFDTNGSERMRIDSAGNVGIGTASPTTNYTNTVHVHSTTAGASVHLTNGAASSANDGLEVFQYGVDGYVWERNSGSLRFGTSATERARIDSSGNLLVGTTDTALYSATTGGGVLLDPNGPTTIARQDGSPLSLNRTSSDGGLLNLRKDGETVGVIGSFLGDSFIGTGDAGITFNNSANGVLPFNTAGVTSDGFVNLGDPAARFKDLYLSGGVKGNNLTFSGNGSSEHARIDSSGNLLVGKTSLNSAVQGIEARADGRLGATYTNGNPAFFNRLSSDGEIVRLLKDGSTVGSIGTDGGRPYFSRVEGGFSLSSNGHMIPATATGDVSDNARDLGLSVARWKDLYLSGGVYLGGTGSANKLDDFEEGNFTPTVSFAAGNGTLSYNTQVGYYIKTGSMVSVHLHISFNKETASGSFRISSLPFTIANSQGARGGASVGYYTGINNVNSNPLFMGDNNTTILSARKPDSTDINQADLDAVTSVWIQYTYYTDS